ncbi:MAG: Crp/Fnr family transcriptional regulator [Bacteroidota bacterium]
MKHKQKNIIESSQLSVFKLLTADELKSLEKTKYEVCYKADELIIKKGTKSSQLMFLTSGLAKSYVESTSGNNIIIRLIKPFEVIGIIASYNNNQHLFSVKAIEDSNCCFYDLAAYKRIAMHNPKVFDKLTENICHRSMEYISRFTSLSHKQVHGRIAEVLLYLYDDIYNQANPMMLTISKHDIAELTGMSKDTALRVLKSFHEDRIIKVDDNNIAILDFKKLTHICING